MPDYIPSPRAWVREQVEAYESSGGTQGTTLRDTGLPVVIITHAGNKTGIGVSQLPLFANSAVWSAPKSIRVLAIPGILESRLATAVARTSIRVSIAWRRLAGCLSTAVASSRRCSSEVEYT